MGKGAWYKLFYKRNPVSYRTFYNEGAIWGAIGPQIFFGYGSPYNKILYGFWIGALLPLIPWFGNQVYKSKYWRYINVPIIVYITGTGSIQSGIIMTFVTSLVFQFILLR